MRIFKNKIFRRIVSPLLLACLFIALDTGVGELLRPVTYATDFNHDIARIEQTGQEVDMLFVGASRTYRTFVPEVFEEKLGLGCVVNAGSSSQPICATYYELKDLVERIHPKRVCIGVIWNLLTHEPNLQSRLIVLDRLSLRNRLQMAAKCFKVSEMPYLLATYRFKDNLSIEQIRTNAAEKRRLAATDYDTFSPDKEYYADTGFVYSYKSYRTGTIPIREAGNFSANKVTKENLGYLDACVELCRKNDIEVTLVTGVTTMMRIYLVGNYQEAVDYYREYAEKHGIAYYNLNYLVGRESFLPDEMMFDYNHTNGEGAHIASERFAEILRKADAGEDVSGYFYENLDALKKDVHRIVAVKADIKADPEEAGWYSAKITSLQNDDVEAVYRLLMKRGGEEEYSVIRDWTSDPVIRFRADGDPEDCTVMVEAGSADESCGHAFQEYSLRKSKADKQDQDEEE